MSTASPVSDRQPISCSLPDGLVNAIAQAHKQWDHSRNTERLWARDPSLWTRSDRMPDLSWLDMVQAQMEELSNFTALSAEVKEDGFTHLVVLATDGSAAGADALRRASRKQNGCLEWIVLDTTDPSVIRSVEARINPARTLFCTLHGSQPAPGTDLLARYFFERSRSAIGDDAKLHFLAVTALEPETGSVNYHHVYRNPGSVLSPFSDFGLLPLAAAGHDIEKLLKGARHMAQLCRERDSHRNPGVALGLLIGTAAQSGRDKLTIVCSPSLRAVGNWIGQLLAGVVPVLTEPPVAADCYGNDRLFVQLRYAHEQDRETDRHLAALESAGHPLVRQVLEDAADLGESLFQWQVAGAVAHATSNDPASKPIEARSDSPIVERPLVKQGDITLLADDEYAAQVLHNGDSAGAVLRRHLDRLNPGDFFGMVAYVPDNPEHEEVLQNMRRGVLESKGTATVLGFGPAFLAAAGAGLLHGLGQGVLLLITCESPDDIRIPNQPLTFAQATAAQAHRDFQKLLRSGRPALHARLTSDVAKALNQLQDLVCAAVEH